MTRNALAVALCAFLLGYQAGQYRGVAQVIQASMAQLVDALPRGACGPTLHMTHVRLEQP